ncbi:MAG: hypothetical protein RL648_193, partial [Verrucomicrobiota bacterium]
MAEKNNPDYTICLAAGQRTLRHALALHITGDERHKDAALLQLDALFDDSIWPDWIDQAHLRFGLPADLRTGMLSQDCGLAFDWLYPFLSANERERLVEGINRRGIRPFLQSMEADPWWSHELNNWNTVIIGGLGVAGMALSGEHPDAHRLVSLSRGHMERYLSIYGSDGSFNESVAYSVSTSFPVSYFNALYYHTRGEINALAQPPFPLTARWTLYAALPGGRFAGFGDGPTELAGRMAFISAIAAANRDSIVQGFAARHMETSADPYALLWYDPDLSSASPEGALPLGKIFPENSGLVFSRSSWDPETPEMVVYGKARQAQNHGHNDLGQLCIDSRGKPLIVDSGSPSIYPEDFFNENRYRYYNASVAGHNVLMFGKREQRFERPKDGIKGLLDLDPISGQYTQSYFDDRLGGYWQIDLTRAYDGVHSVRRTVIHLLPGWVAVLDEAHLETTEEVSLRWHTARTPQYEPSGHFEVAHGDAFMACRLAVLEGSTKSLTLKRHAYEPPYDTDRTGQLLQQRHEPYLEFILHAESTRILTLFASTDGPKTRRWEETSQGTWMIGEGQHEAVVTVNKQSLLMAHPFTNRALKVNLQGGQRRD